MSDFRWTLCRCFSPRSAVVSLQIAHICVFSPDAPVMWCRLTDSSRERLSSRSSRHVITSLQVDRRLFFLFCSRELVIAVVSAQMKTATEAERKCNDFYLSGAPDGPQDSSFINSLCPDQIGCGPVQDVLLDRCRFQEVFCPQATFWGLNLFLAFC